ncbi:MAG: copper homeostasis protein CutC [Chitinophagaceae bacterium]|jgi:copper homeostasis protein|nr:copper homeostasis protein CutC [Chitinophagaceae bacterium]
MPRLLEICVFNTATAMEAAAAGADRIELCENYANGGTTPSYGYLKTTREKVSIPIFPMIRPRGGDYYHRPEEIDIIQRDIALCKELGFEGVVFGLLNRDGSIDRENTARLVELAYPLDVTFHRAFDRCKDPLEALETIIACGCTRILTSGQHPKAPEGKVLIQQLVEQAGDRIIIMPGSGINSHNIADMMQFTGAKEFHGSARILRPSPSEYTNPLIPEDFSQDFTDAVEIRKLKQLLSQ